MDVFDSVICCLKQFLYLTLTLMLPRNVVPYVTIFSLYVSWKILVQW